MKYESRLLCLVLAFILLFAYNVGVRPLPALGTLASDPRATYAIVRTWQWSQSGHNYVCARVRLHPSTETRVVGSEFVLSLGAQTYFGLTATAPPVAKYDLLRGEYTYTPSVSADEDIGNWGEIGLQVPANTDNSHL